MKKKQVFALFCTVTLLMSGCGNTQPKSPANPSPNQASTESSQGKDDKPEYSEKDLSKKMKDREKEYMDQREEPGYETETSLFGALSNTIGAMNKDVMSIDGMTASASMTESMAEEVVEAGGYMPSSYDDVMGDFSTAEFSSIQENGFRSVQISPFSTFAADVDTASYSLLRRDTVNQLGY